MKSNLLHTPEGVRDIYNSECENKLYLQDKLHSIMKGYGYHDIQTPSFEFFDVYSKEIGTIPSKELYKFFDREGNTLVLRPDFTPSIARCAAKYFAEEDSVLRLCYSGSTFINTMEHRGRLKESTEMGVECIGEDSVEIDGEIIATMVDLLKASGLENFQIEIGEIGFFKGLLEETGIDEITAEALREQISNKNFFGVEELLSDLPVKEEVKTVFMRLPELFGSIDKIAELKTLTKNTKALAAIERLEALHQVLKLYDIEKYVTYDLGMLSKYKYYTGIIFHAYTYGSGEALIKGGRYDNLIGQFGKPSPSIGFSVDIDKLLTTLRRQNISIPGLPGNVMVLFHSEDMGSAIATAKTLRSQGICVETTRMQKDKDAYLEYAKEKGYKEVILFEKGASKTITI